MPSSSNSNKVKYAYGFAISFLVMFGISFLVFDRLDDDISSSYIYWMPFAIACTVIFGVLSSKLFISIEKWFGPTFQDKSFELQLYERANRLRKEAQLVLAIMFILIIGSAVVFFKASSFAHEDANKLLGQDLTANLQKAEISALLDRSIHEKTSNETSVAAGVQTKARDADSNAQVQKGKSTDENIDANALPRGIFQLTWIYFGLSIAIRVGDVAAASFLTFMLVRIYRYNLRLSAFYYSRADAVVISTHDRFKKTKPEALPALFDANFDFGKEHPSLVSDFATLMKALYPPRNQMDKDQSAKSPRELDEGGPRPRK